MTQPIQGSARVRIEADTSRALSRNGGDEDWIVITSGDPDDWTPEMVADKLAASGVELHTTPRWTIRICCHA